MYIEPRSDEQILHEYKDDMFNKFEDHVACWELDHRGGVGETAIHLCVLHDNPVTMDIAKMLLRRYPKMALDYFEDDEYYGRFVCYSCGLSVCVSVCVSVLLSVCLCVCLCTQ